MKTKRSEGTAIRDYTPLRGGNELFLFIIIIAVSNYMAKEDDKVELLQH